MFCVSKVKLSVKVKLFVSLLCVCAILPGKAIPEMTYTVSGGTLNPTHSLTRAIFLQKTCWNPLINLYKKSRQTSKIEFLCK